MLVCIALIFRNGIRSGLSFSHVFKTMIILLSMNNLTFFSGYLKCICEISIILHLQGFCAVKFGFMSAYLYHLCLFCSKRTSGFDMAPPGAAMIAGTTVAGLHKGFSLDLFHYTFNLGLDWQQY